MFARLKSIIIVIAMTIAVVVFPAIIIMISTTSAQTTPTATSRTTTTTAAAATTTASSTSKIFYLFTAEHQGVNQTRLGIPPDTFSPDILEANAGDNITIHFYNTDATDSHTFTVGAPYDIDKVVAPGQNTTLNFKAADQGIYRFYCRFHLPTMEGQLIVLPPPVVEKPTAVSK